MIPLRLHIFILISMITASHGLPQNPQQPVHRKAAVAGQFYPADSARLAAELRTLFANTTKTVSREVLALIVPHAGYVFSGSIAADAFALLNPDREYKRIFLIGSSHRTAFDGASVYASGNYITPLGMVEVDTAIARKLSSESALFSTDPGPHMQEHSLEVELPFLQYRLRKPFLLVPVILGTDNPSSCSEIARLLSPYFTDENLFVISTDFSHYPSYTEAIQADSATAEAIQSGKPEVLLRQIRNCHRKGITGLATTLCGWSSVLTLMYITENAGALSYSRISYSNSGDSPFGDKTRVVGYFSMAVTRSQNNSKDFYLSSGEKEILLNIARNALEKKVRKNETYIPDSSKMTGTLKSKCGAFVTLHKDGSLRGCIGQFAPDNPLCFVVRDMAIAAALHDPRFSKVSEQELKSIDIEISVLSPLRKIDSVNEIVLGKHGIYIKKGVQSGTFLPQVATETGWNLEEFLGHCSADKAGLGWYGWKDAEIFVYTAIVFGEKE